MSSPYKVGQLRPSQLLFSYGIGAIADLLNFSVIIMGGEEWDVTQMIEIKEQRLLIEVRRQLGKKVKRLLSPCAEDERENNNPSEDKKGIPVAPFPSYMVCPQCRLLAPLESELFRLIVPRHRSEQAYYVHENCHKMKGKKPPTVIPVRFVAACEKGHLDEFPWNYFVHQGNTNCSGPLRLIEYGVSGSTNEIFVQCDRCENKRILSEAFGEVSKQNLPRCRGRRPHLQDFEETCDQQVVTMLLGASNSWFGVTLSALSLPSDKTEIEELVEKNWDKLEKATTVELLELILQVGNLQELAKYPLKKIWQVVCDKQEKPEEENSNNQDLKTPEWLAFSAPENIDNTSEFQLSPIAPPRGFEDYFSKTVLVERLKEVRAFIGFTRIQSLGDLTESKESINDYLAQISRRELEWVPASEIRGEGIFLQFNETKLNNWEEQKAVQDQKKKVGEAQKNWLNSRGLDSDKAIIPDMRYLLLHSFAHALMRQLAIACGYNAASLRERIYSARSTTEHGAQAGILIYTAASDSEGTLGGLVSLGQPDILGSHIRGTLEIMRLCASDPLCAEHQPSDASLSLHWASCHACLFSPETSCERGNKLLDRSLLIPTMSNPNLAFFE